METLGCAERIQDHPRDAVAANTLDVADVYLNRTRGTSYFAQCNRTTDISNDTVDTRARAGLSDYNLPPACVIPEDP